MTAPTRKKSHVQTSRPQFLIETFGLGAGRQPFEVTVRTRDVAVRAGRDVDDDVAALRHEYSSSVGELRLTTATICCDLGWHEDIHEDLADHYRVGFGRLPRLARIATGRAGRACWGERLRDVPRPVVRGARRHASRRSAPRRDPP